jgi:hypothetical protein
MLALRAGHSDLKRSVALFREFLGDSGQNEELNLQLRRFFANICKQNCSALKKSSLISQKDGICVILTFKMKQHFQLPK